MLVVCSDTHGTDGPRLTGRTRAAVSEADAVVHAGDFGTEAALDGFRDVADGPVYAVHGNADSDAVRAALPADRVVTYGEATIAVTHTKRGGATALSLFGREAAADCVVFGHTHRPAVASGPPTLLNPGSHADPRGGPATHAELRESEAGLAGSIVTREGAERERFTVECGSDARDDDA